MTKGSGKRTKSATPARLSSAKLAVKKKRKNDARGTKYKNAELMANLDGQAHILYDLAASTRTTTETPLVTRSNIHELTTVLSSL